MSNFFVYVKNENPVGSNSMEYLPNEIIHYIMTLMYPSYAYKGIGLVNKRFSLICSMIAKKTDREHLIDKMANHDNITDPIIDIEMIVLSGNVSYIKEANDELWKYALIHNRISVLHHLYSLDASLLCADIVGGFITLEIFKWLESIEYDHEDINNVASKSVDVLRYTIETGIIPLTEENIVDILILSTYGDDRCIMYLLDIVDVDNNDCSGLYRMLMSSGKINMMNYLNNMGYRILRDDVYSFVVEALERGILYVEWAYHNGYVPQHITKLQYARISDVDVFRFLDYHGISHTAWYSSNVCKKIDALKYVYEVKNLRDKKSIEMMFSGILVGGSMECLKYYISLGLPMYRKRISGHIFNDFEFVKYACEHGYKPNELDRYLLLKLRDAEFYDYLVDKLPI